MYSMQPTGKSHRFPWTGAGVIVLATLLTYAPAMRAGFVWNDHDLTSNIVFEDDGLYRVWFTTDSINYWPMVWTSYWLEYQIWGFEPAGYHVVNIVLHAIASILIWRVLERLAVPGAWFAALVFALHPVNVESVAWVTQRKNVLSLLFFAAAVLSFLRHDDRAGRGVGGMTVFWFVLAMLSKGAAAPLPVVLMLCLWWRRDWGEKPDEPEISEVSHSGRFLKTLARDALRVWPCFAVTVVMSGVEIWFQYVRAIGHEIVRDDSFLDRLTGAGWVVWFYLGKAVWPTDLTFVYPRWEIDAGNWRHHVPNLFLFAVLALSWTFRRGWGRPVLFALIYYIVMLSPVLGFFDIYFMLYSFVADHYQYLAIIGPIALFAGAGATLLQHLRGAGRSLIQAGGFALPVLLAVLSWQQSQAYHDTETLWRDTLRKNPNAWLAHYNLGILLADRGDREQAAVHFREVLRIRPEDAWAHHELARVRQSQGRFREAVAHFRESLARDPTIPDTHYNLGSLLQQLGHAEQAEFCYRKALKLKPDFAAAHNNLGTVLQILNRPDEAIAHYRKAIKIEPANAQAHYNLGKLLIQAGASEAGEKHLELFRRLTADRLRR